MIGWARSATRLATTPAVPRVVPAGRDGAVILEHCFAHIPQDARRGRAWLTGLQPLYDGALTPDAVVSEDALLRYHHHGAIVLTVERGPARIETRTPQHVAAQALDHVVLRAHSGGPVQVEVAGWAGEARSGDLVLFDFAEPIRLPVPAATGVAVVVPRRRLMDPAADGGVPRGQVLDVRREPLVRLLSGYLRDLADTLGSATPAQLGELVPATLALLREPRRMSPSSVPPAWNRSRT